MPPLHVLLVNPPIFDFTAYDFWLRPYGLFRVAAQLQKTCRLSYFDFLVSKRRDPWGRGCFEGQEIPRSEALRDVVRIFRRFGRPRAEFREFLAT